MNRVELRNRVRSAVGVEWSTFAQRHPRLAAVLDEDLLVEAAVQSLADDPEFRTAMDQAAAVGMGAQVLGDVAQRYVREWLDKLL